MLNGPNYDTAETRESRHKPGAGHSVFVLVLVTIGFWAAWRFAGPGAEVSADDRHPGSTPVLLMFTADWCAPCQTFKARVLADERVTSRVKRSCRLDNVDLTKWEGKPAATAARYGVDAVPELILVNARGNEIARYEGPTDAEQFARWLDRHAR